MQPITTYVKATPMQRFLAILIDSVVASIPQLVLGIISYNLASIGGLIAIVYYVIRDALPIGDGQGIGKKVMGIKVIHAADRTTIKGDYVASLVRQLSLLIPFLNFYDMYLVLTDKPRLGDQWAKTEVVKA